MVVAFNDFLYGDIWNIWMCKREKLNEIRLKLQNYQFSILILNL
jgi:hypothetical protein